MATTTPTTRIGVIVGSQRAPRAGLQISTWILNLLQHHQVQSSSATTNDNDSITLSLIDLNTFALPLYDESAVPSEIHSPSSYAHEHTRLWSQEISSYGAFIFVTPQYNWGYPAGLKNAIDYLYHEWKGKPAMVVSYGGHGGGKAAEQLLQVLMGLRMRVVKKRVGLKFVDTQMLEKAARGEDLGLEVKPNDTSGVWEKEKSDIVDAFEDLVKLLKERNDK